MSKVLRPLGVIVCKVGWGVLRGTVEDVEEAEEEAAAAGMDESDGRVRKELGVGVG